MTHDSPPDDGNPQVSSPLPLRGWLAGFALGLGLALVAGYRLLRPAPRPGIPPPVDIESPPEEFHPAPPAPRLPPPESPAAEESAFSPIRLIAFFALVAALVSLMLDLPLEAGLLVLAGTLTAVVLVWVYTFVRKGYLRRAWKSFRRIRRETPLPQSPLRDRRIPPLMLLIELGVVTLMALSVTGDYRVADPTTELPGGEAEWLTSSVYLAHDSLRDYGYLPTWQPYLRFGEPLLEDPFSFVLNPLSSWPSLLVGGLQGIKYSVVLYAVFAALGGWFLAWTLGLGTLGRLLLAGLLLGKGNMTAMIGTGYFQLGVSQAYLPWVTGGVLLILRGHRRRWPVILTALMFTLMFWAGNVWYTLPLLLSLGVLALTHAIRIHPGQWINRVGLRRLALAGLLTMLLSAALLLPLWAHRDYIGGHQDEIDAGAVVSLDRIIPLYTDPSPASVSALPVYTRYRGTQPGTVNLYYSYVTPLWFLALLFVLLPPIWPILHRPPVAGWWRVWSVGIFMVVFCTLWGAGGSDLFLWLYAHVPLLGQWRFVGRALAVASFWLAVLIAMRADGLWRALTWKLEAALHTTLRTALLRGMLAAVLVAGVEVAIFSVTRTWDRLTQPVRLNYDILECVSWLRGQYPDEPLSLQRASYQSIATFIDNRVRLYTITADYFARPMDWTLGQVDLTSVDQRFIIIGDAPGYALPGGGSYTALRDEPGHMRCIYENRFPAVSYAFAAPPAILDMFRPPDPAMNATTLSQFPVEETTPITDFVRLPDQITLHVDSDADQPLAVVVSELAFPGWQVTVDGARHKLEVVGGAIGVLLPPDGQAHTVQFAYRPPLFYAGGIITVVTAALCALYLLEADRLLRGL